jgi:uncharacterized membrane protein
VSIIDRLLEFAADPLAPSVHGGDDDGAGWIAFLDGLLTTVSNLLDSGGSFELLPGLSGMGVNFHPVIVHFPIALLTAFFVLDIVGSSLRRPQLRHHAAWMLYLGAAGAVAAAASGLIAEATVPHGEVVHDIMTWHGRIGLGIAGLSVFLACWRGLVREPRSAMARGLRWFLAGLLVLLIIVGADLGGLMVFQHGVGVKSLQTPDVHHHDTANP